MFSAVATLTTYMLYLTNIVSGEVCYVCGNDQEFITNPDNILPIPEEYESPYADVDCKTLETAGMNGFIAEEACADLHDSSDFKMYCGCSSSSSSETNEVPTGFPAMEASPTFQPSEVTRTFSPTKAKDTNNPTRPVPKPSPSSTNSNADTEKPSTYISPSKSPIDGHFSSEHTELPSTIKGIDDGEHLNDDPEVKSSTPPSVTPSGVPSENPSSVPSSAPSDTPSDVPSIQPTTNGDVSGVVVESSANSAAVGSIAHTLTTLVVGGLFLIR